MRSFRSFALIAVLGILAAPAKAQTPTAPSQFSVAPTQVSSNCLVQTGATTYCFAYDKFCVSWAGAAFQCVSSFAAAAALAVNGVAVPNANLVNSAQVTFTVSTTTPGQITAAIPSGAVTFANLSAPPTTITGSGISLSGLTFK